MLDAYDVQLQEPTCKAIEIGISETVSLWDIIDWIGEDDFIAFTCGSKISVPTADGEVTISLKPEATANVPMRNRYMFIIRDNIRDTVVVASVGQYLVRTGRGYEVFNSMDDMLQVYQITG